MASLARKIKRQQPPTVMRAPFAKPIEEPPEKVRRFGEECYKFGHSEGYKKGHDDGFEAGFRAAYGHFLANMAYLYKYHADIFDNPSNRFRILFDIMKMMNEDYVTKRTPKMLDALDDLRRQGVLIEVKEE